MGTRYLTCVYFNGEYKIAQYGQEDGYPGGHGLTVLNFLKSYREWSFKQKLMNSKLMPESTFIRVKKPLITYLMQTGSISEKDAVKVITNHPCFSDYVGAHVLHDMQASYDGLTLPDSRSFASSFDCEWAYVIDYDENALEVYMGDNTLPLEPGDRFYTGEAPDHGIYPVRLAVSSPLNSLPGQNEFKREISAACRGLKKKYKEKGGMNAS